MERGLDETLTPTRLRIRKLTEETETLLALPTYTRGRKERADDIYRSLREVMTRLRLATEAAEEEMKARADLFYKMARER